MGTQTKIEWTKTVDDNGNSTSGATWNPLAGCSKVSAGCANCYAIKDAHRLAENPNAKVSSKYKGTTTSERGSLNWTGRINLANDDVLTQPLRWTRPRRVFVNSMADLFHESVPDEWIDKIFAVMALSPQHTFQLLTKRAERMRDYVKSLKNYNGFLNDFWIGDALENDFGRYIPQLRSTRIDHPLQNCWLGVSVENQKAADERIPLLLQTPAAIRWLSCEPLLGAVNLRFQETTIKEYANAVRVQNYIRWRYERCEFCDGEGCCGCDHTGEQQKGCALDWVVVGGESGANARPSHPDWFRSLRDQCQSASVPFFFKQHGNWLHESQSTYDFDFSALKHAFEDGTTSCNVGKKQAGRMLDGVFHDEFPVIKPQN